MSWQCGYNEPLVGTDLSGSVLIILYIAMSGCEKSPPHKFSLNIDRRSVGLLSALPVVPRLLCCFLCAIPL